MKLIYFFICMFHLNGIQVHADEVPTPEGAGYGDGKMERSSYNPKSELLLTEKPKVKKIKPIYIETHEVPTPEGAGYGDGKMERSSYNPKNPCEVVAETYAICGDVKYVRDVKNNDVLKRSMKNIEEFINNPKRNGNAVER